MKAMTTFVALRAFVCMVLMLPTKATNDCEYDFIVIGGGSAGAVVVNRLSEVSGWNVLLLEAGGVPPCWTEVPYLAPKLLKTKVDWAYYTEPDNDTCLSMRNNASLWSRGKALGGTSILNGMQYIRGNQKDYDNWESMGNSGWNSSSALYYFKKSEDFRNGQFYSDWQKYHGQGGDLTVQANATFSSNMKAALLEGAKEMGSSIGDCNGEYQTRFMPLQSNTRDGRRCSTHKAFLNSESFRKRNNAYVVTYALVTKILINENNVAYGVTFKKNGVLRNVTAKKEVILSAGTIGSPQILMLSGVGPKDHLEKVGVPLVLDLQGVGENLQDHVTTMMVFTADTDGSLDPISAFRPDNVLNWAMDKSSPLNVPSAIEVMGFLHSKYSNDSEDWPDIQIFAADTSFLTDPTSFVRPPFSLTVRAYNSVFRRAMFKKSHMIFPVNVRPKSRGYIKLKSSDPEKYPAIYPSYFDVDQDLKVLIEGCRFAYNLSRTNALQKVKSTFWKKPYPGCKEFEFGDGSGSDEYWTCMLRHMTMTLWHPVGTCKMGPNPSEGAVVDPRLRVHGIDRLRVVDASIMPVITAGNTHGPTVMIGEKASDMIKKDWSDSMQRNVDAERVHCPNAARLRDLPKFAQDQMLNGRQFQQYFRRNSFNLKQLTDIINQACFQPGPFGIFSTGK